MAKTYLDVVRNTMDADRKIRKDMKKEKDVVLKGDKALKKIARN